MKGGLGNILKQAQAMQENLKRAQEELAALEVTGSAGGSMVRVTMTGRHDVKRVEIDATLLKDDKEVLEDLVAAAMNDAVRKVEQAAQEKMSSITGGMSLPGMPFPF
ncbi:MAG: YbaB/EbfC family nucleoid-associated protein [Gammaproteobacteria bacterium]|nr:MAG: YbaB/EbfC family nucleoid-associated protein [Gammaproteobacteria bacterium]